MSRSRESYRCLLSLVVVLVLPGCTRSGAVSTGRAEARREVVSLDQVLLGRQMVISHACGDCHGGGNNPAATGWLAGRMAVDQDFKIGPFTTRARNLTPDNATGLGRFSERQFFNSLRFGLRPGAIPDVTRSAAIVIGVTSPHARAALSRGARRRANGGTLDAANPSPRRSGSRQATRAIGSSVW